MAIADAYRDTSWFKAAEGDIVFFQWLLDRCFELCDVKPTQSEAAAQNLYDWFKLRQTLRLELGLTSTEAEPQREVKNPLWAAEKIVEEVGGALQILRQELEDGNSMNPRVDSKLEREVVAEVVQNATELLLSRVTREDEEMLLRWLEILEGGVSGCENEVSLPKVALEAEMLWASEVQRIEGMSLEEEKKREAVAQEIEFMLFVKDVKQRQVAPLFAFHMHLLVEALDDELDQLNLNARSRLEAFTNSQIVQNELLCVSKRRKNDLFDMKTMLECSPACTIDAVASHARVPVLRFRYMKSGIEYKCDFCFDNELGVRNTRLLRAYASFDDRARELGLAVKHWAKQRGITDTASGFLSSYSFVLLSIYYLQIVHVLPNLQNLQLLELAEVFPEYYDRENIAVCEDRDIAQIYHKQATPDSNYLDASLPALLFGFFNFYATQFDYLNHVVAIRSPEKAMLKTSQWGSKSKTWRMSIQDPLQTTRDVGGVLHFSAQRKFTHELRRAHEMLEQSESFLDVVCLKQE